MSETGPKKTGERSDKATQGIIDEAAERALGVTVKREKTPLDPKEIEKNIIKGGKVFDESSSSDSE